MLINNFILTSKWSRRQLSRGSDNSNFSDFKSNF